jgi:hypothetical protein
MGSDQRSISAVTEYRTHGRFEIPDKRFSQAEAFYLQNLIVPSTRLESLIASGARRLPQLARLLFKSSSNGNLLTDLSEEIRFVTGYLTDAGVTTPGGVSVLGLRDYAHSTRQQAVLFFFDAKREAPIAIAKCRTADGANALKNEFDTLQHLQETLPEHMKRTVPDPLAFFRTSRKRAVLLESALPGSSIYFQMRNFSGTPQRIEEHLRAAFDWLREFQGSTVRDGCKLRDIFQSDWESNLAIIADIRDLSVEERICTDELEAAASRYGNQSIPIAATQGDFWTRNILTHGKSVGIVDWEDYKREGPPLDDAFMFSISYGRGYQWNAGQWLDPENAFRKTFFEVNPLSSIVKTSLVNFSRELGIDREVLYLVLGIFLARKTAAAARAGKTITDEEVLVWRSLFQVYATAKKSAFFG